MQIDSSAENQYSTIESIFTLNLKESLLKFQRYQQDVMGERDLIIDQIKKKFAQLDNDINNQQQKAAEMNNIMEKYDRAQSILME